MNGPLSRRARLAATRGFTLIEIMVSTLLISVLMLAAGTVMGLGARTAHQHELIADARSSSILAERTISLALRNAAFGATGGVLTRYSGTPLMPVYTVNRTTGPDDLYILSADPNAGFEDCLPGTTSAASKVVSTTGGVTLACATTLKTGDSAIAYIPTAIQSPGLLLTGLNVASNVIQSYNESAAAGFTPSDLLGGKYTVARVKMLHFYVANNPATGRSALWQETVAPGPLASQQPFVTQNNGQVVADGVEDLQVTGECDSQTCVGLSTLNGDPALYSETYYANTNTSSYFPAGSVMPGTLTALRALQVSLTAITKPFRNADNSFLAGTGAVSLQDHIVTSPPVDGMKRVIVEERMEIPNLGLFALNYNQN